MRLHHRLLVVGSLCAVSLPLHAAGKCAQWVARVASAQGAVEARVAGAPDWKRVALNDTYCPGDSLRVGPHSRAAVELNNETIVRLDQHSALTFSELTSQVSLLDLLKGAAHFIARVPHALKIKTPYVNAAVEGTEFLLRVEADATDLIVYEGRVSAENDNGRVSVSAGQAAVTRAGQAPVLRTLVRPRDAVQWSLYYPAIASYRPEEFSKSPDGDKIARSIAAYRAGDVPRALAEVKDADPAARDPRFFTYRAALLLSVGRVDDATADLDHALRLAPQDSDALAQQALIAVVRNDNDRALALANDAVARDPHSATAHLAASYAHQARFDLDAATTAAQSATQNDPDDALAWARLAELHAATGRLDRALNAAHQAAARNPSLARTQAVLGFAYLTQIKTGEAKLAFEKAIALDSSDPLPRLGLGLARIRAGALNAGRREIEIAASLDPSNSLVRSYLGKAYYEEKRDRLAGEQFSMAKDMDPKDPTPWFYEAIQKQTQNRPVEALQSLQKSIELNDNRAVYRSRLMLDQDVAARGASLGRIYGDLGFEQLGLIEGYRSIATDPSNFSAHRLLADSYIGRPRHEVARVSELLQSQLLQPLSIHPILPRLAESNPPFQQDSGPSAPSFSEFNPLFVRNRFTFQGAVLTGSDDTSGYDAAISGLFNSFALSAGQFRYQTDGFRPNNDLTQTISNVSIQAAVSPQLSLQAEYRDRALEHGDLRYDFDLLQFNPSLRRKLETTTTRAGANYAFPGGSRFLLSAIVQDEKDVQSLSFGNRVLNRENSVTEAQYIYPGSSWQVITGLGRARMIGDIDFSGFLTIPASAHHQNAYTYVTHALAGRPKWTIGASVDSLEDDVIGDIRKTNPKFGVIWNVRDNTTLRLAAFRAFKRTLVTDQTIEPTQVAGFNQFFDDRAGTASTRMGIGLDHQISTGLFGGVEISRRELDVPTLALFGQTVIEGWTETLYRTYVNWAPTPRFAVTGGYEREAFRVNDTPIFFVPDTRTSFMPLALAYYGHSGIYGRIRTTFVNQKVDQASFENGDSFMLVDVTLSYRLPKRRSTVNVQIHNLTDEPFHFKDLGFRKAQEESPLFRPERTVSVSVSLAL